MKKQDAIKIFEEKKVRTVWDSEQEKWFFSIVDVIAVLSDSPNPQVYWRVMKKRLKDEGNETVTNCNGLKMVAPDGKMRMTDVADTEQLFRLIQSIPSPKAEPFKLWLGQIAAERLDEIQDPELSIDRALKQYLELGLNMLAVTSAKDISQAVNPVTFDDNMSIAQQGGNVSRVARLALENRTGKNVVTALNAKTALVLNKDNNDDKKIK